MWHRRLLTSWIVAFASLILVSTCFGMELTGKVKWSGQVDLQEPVIVSPGATLTIAPGTQVSVANTQVKIRSKI